MEQYPAGERERIKEHIVLVGFGLAAFFWVFESFVHVYVFHEGNLITRIFSPEPHEAWMRLAVMGTLLIFSFYVNSTLTKRKEEEETLNRTREELRESNRLKDLFADIVRHDILNSLNVISGMAIVLKEEESREKMREELEIVNKNVKKILELIEDASKYAKVGNLEEIELKEGDLGEILKECVGAFESQARDRGVKISYDAAGRYPTYVNPFVRDIFLNLLSNAVKYSPPDSEVTVEIGGDDKEWEVSVRDSGEGIPDDSKTEIFERFTRRGKGGIKGTGLGLAIAKKLVELHGGRIWVEDNPGGGSLFLVTLPKIHISA